MRVIPYSSIVEAVRKLCVDAATRLPGDVVAALQKARGHEESQRGQWIIDQCIENAVLAASENDPVCQDTGVAVFFVELGSDVTVSGGTITDAIHEGTRRGYRDGYLRKSMVADPLFDRKNTGDNTPAMVHLESVPGETLLVTLLPKGGGSENMSALTMLKPADGREGVVQFVTDTVVKSGGRPCPPVIVGVGIGGTADHAMLLAKKSLLRPVGRPSGDERYARLEHEIFKKVNASGVGPQGLGGAVTALAVHVEFAPCHLASLPVAVCLNCHAARRAAVAF